MRLASLLMSLFAAALLASSVMACASPSSSSSALTSISWSRAMSNGNPTIAEFGRGTCIPCKQMKPILEDLAREYEGRLNVLIVDVDEYAALTRQYGIMVIPTQIFLGKDGKEASRHVGLFPKEDIIAELAKIGVK